MSVLIHVGGIERALPRVSGTLDALGGKRARAVMRRALNRSLREGRAMATRIAREAYTARREKLFDGIFLRNARGDDISGLLEISGKPGVSEYHFRARPNVPQPPAARPKAGVSVQIRRGGRREVRMNDKPGYSKPFIMRKKQGGFGVFTRKNFSRKARYELSLGPAPIQALQRKADQERVVAAISEIFPQSLRDEMDRMLAKITGGKA
ncbi:hypothetical protein [uncultured Desulfovibrio sp.]|uniref:hypothetical protein n=2 Tax=uncultured Desulfovibrio sp. TaxID=167968 RepID=UPI00260D28AE|nr:hypothetical protein [uncultured Desulfovibrio sp.]